LANPRTSKKRQRQALVKRERNRGVMSTMRSAVKAVRQASDKESATTALSAAIGTIDHTAQKGVIHPNKAARYKSRLTRQVQALS
jgi:small subunit ribosomal protein S20